MTDFPAGPEGSPTPGSGLGISADALVREQWRRLMQRRDVILATAGFIVVLTMIATFLATPQYTATTTLEIRRLAPEIVEFREVLPTDPWGYNDFYQTQYNILQSRTVSRLAAERLDLMNRPEYATRKPSPLRRMLQWMTSGGSEEENDEEVDDGGYTPLDAAGDFVLARVSISPVRNSHLVYVSVTDRNAELAADIANAVARAYQEFSLSELYDTTGDARDFLTRDVARVRGEITKLQKQLQAYGVEKEILALSDGSLDISERALEEVNLRYANAKTKLAAAEARWDSIVVAGAESMPEVLNSQVISHLREERADLERQVQQMRERFAPGWPALMELEEKLNTARAQIESESESIASRVRAAAELEYTRAQTELSHLDRERESLKREVQRVKQAGIEYAGLQSEIETKRAVLKDLISRESETDTTYRLREAGTSNVRIVDAAQTPGAPSHPNKKKRLVMSLMLGLMAGCGLALLIGYLDSTIKNEYDVEQVARVSVLGRVPLTRSLTIPQSKVIDSEVVTHQLDLATHFDPRSTFAEAFKSLRTSFLLASPDQPSRTVAVTSCQPGDGKSTVALNLAIVLAQMGRRVLLVDGDLRRPRIHKTLSLDNHVGLSSVLSGNARFEDVRQSIDIPGLTLVTSGPIPPNPSELLGAKALDQFIEETTAQERFDHIIFDCAPVLTVTDAVLLSTKVDATILLARAGVTARDALRQSMGRLRELHANVMGVVLNAALEDSGYYYYQYEPDEPETIGVARAMVARLKRRRAG